MIDQTVLLFGEMWTLGFRIRKVVECFKQELMGYIRSMEDGGA